LAPGPVVSQATTPMPASPRLDPLRPRVAALSPERFAVQVTISKSTHEKLRYAQELLSHKVPSNDLAAVLDRALDALIAQLEKRKLAATSRPRKPSSQPTNPRTIPSHVRRAVWKRDQGRCTFVSLTGRRCESREFLEFDHVLEVARGGTASLG